MVFKKKWLSFVKDVGSISVDIFENMLHEYVASEIKQVSQSEIDPSLLRWLCNVVENSIEKKQVIDEKIDKKRLVLNEYYKLKPNSRQHEQFLINIIEDLHNSNQIKKVSTKTKLYHKIKSMVFSSSKK